MAFGGPTRGSGIRTALSALVWSIVPPSLVLPAQTTAQTQLPGYAQADDAFMRLTLDERVKLQVLLTAAGYWPDVPEAGFGAHLFNAVLQFQVDNGFPPIGTLNDQQMNRLTAVAGAVPQQLEVPARAAPDGEQSDLGPYGFAACGRIHSYGPSVRKPAVWCCAQLRLLSGIHPAHLFRILV